MLIPDHFDREYAERNLLMEKICYAIYFSIMLSMIFMNSAPAADKAVQAPAGQSAVDRFFASGRSREETQSAAGQADLFPWMKSLDMGDDLPYS